MRQRREGIDGAAADEGAACARDGAVGSARGRHRVAPAIGGASGYRGETAGTPLPADGACIATGFTIAANGHVAVTCGSSGSSTSSGTTVTYGTRYRRAYLRAD